MLLTADWVIPGGRPPIEGGGVLVRGKSVVAVGRAAELAEHEAAGERVDYGACVIAPGLVNAHTHLSLTALEGTAPPADLSTWISRIVRGMSVLDEDDLAISAAHGAQRCLAAGVVAVGDIVYGPEGLAAAADLGLAGTFFWEVLGIPESLLAEELADKEYPVGKAQTCSSRHRCALSPHAVYTCGPHLIKAVAAAAAEQGAPFAMHVAESPAESELLLTGGGVLAATAHRLAVSFNPPRSSVVRYLDRLGALEGMTAVHCVQVSSGDIGVMARKVRGVVTCPRSNEYLAAGTAPVQEMLAAGIRMGIGTDSAASNPGLDLFEDARTLLGRGVSARNIVEMLTTGGAKAIGLDHAVGKLEVGRMPDLVVVRTGPTRDPEAALIHEGGAETIEAVLAGGLWRVRRGEFTFDPCRVEEAAGLVAAKVRLALRL